MRTATLDERRRLVMPPECPPNSAVIVQQIDEDTWVVKRAREERNFKTVLIPVIDALPRDPEWDQVEKAFGEAMWKKLPPPEDA
jgi:hypothetical protein